MCDLIVCDRLRDKMSEPCLKYCLAEEGVKTSKASETAALADTHETNFLPDGHYTGNRTTEMQSTDSAKSNVSQVSRQFSKSWKSSKGK